MGERVHFGDNPSVRRVMEYMKTAFHPRHFDDVEEILTAQEKKWKDEKGLLKEENARLRLDKLVVEAQVTELRTQMTELENNKSKAEAAAAEWKNRFENSEPEIIELRNGKSVAEETTAAWKTIFEDLKPEIIELRNSKSESEAAAAEWKNRFEDLEPEIIELRNSKSEAEAAAAKWKNRFEALESRISQLQNDAELLKGVESPISKNIEEGLDENCSLPNQVNTEANCNENPCQVRLDKSRDTGSKGDVTVTATPDRYASKYHKRR